MITFNNVTVFPGIFKKLFSKCQVSRICLYSKNDLTLIDTTGSDVSSYIELKSKVYSAFRRRSARIPLLIFISNFLVL